MNRTQALREIELLENYEFDRGDAPARLLYHLGSKDAEVALAALRASSSYLGLPGVFDEVFRLAAENPDEEVRGAACAALWPVIQEGSAWEEAFPRPTGPQEHLEPMVPREIYLRTRGHLLEKVDAPMESMEVRRRCLEALGHLGFLPDIRALVLRFYHQAPNPWVRVSALYAMGLQRDEVFERIVLEELHGRQPPIVVEALHAASNLRLEAAWARAQELVRSPNRQIRFEAIASIGALAPIEQAEALIARLQARNRSQALEQAFEIAREALAVRREERSGDGWNLDQVWDEIEEMTDGGEEGPEEDRDSR